MKHLTRFLTLSCLVAIGGCTPFGHGWFGRGSETPRLATNLPAHESWCYKTLGQIDCYPGPQRFPPESLISVDPPSRFPLTREAYAAALREYNLKTSADE